MKHYTQKALRNMVNRGAAIDVTRAQSRRDIPESYTQIGYASGVYGCNGKLLQGQSGQLYAITGRTSALYRF